MNEVPDLVEDIDIDANNRITYVGFAETGSTLTSNPTFKIKRVAVAIVGNKTFTTTMWAEGNTKYNKIWDDRDAYNYSFKK
jgi:hypothetical protein